jgi:hypothetical protein
MCEFGRIVRPVTLSQLATADTKSQGCKRSTLERAKGVQLHVSYRQRKDHHMALRELTHDRSMSIWTVV